MRSALQNCRFEFPARRITVNLAPADLPKESGRFDLPIALGILAASGQVPANRLAEYEFAGELALTGELRPIRGALAMTLKASGDGVGERNGGGTGARRGGASGADVARCLRASDRARSLASPGCGARDHCQRSHAAS